MRRRTVLSETKEGLAPHLEGTRPAIDNRQPTIDNRKGRSPLIRPKVLSYLALIAVGGAAYYFFAYRPRRSTPIEAARVVPDRLPLVDSPAEVRMVIANLRAGDEVQVLDRTRNWSQIRIAGGSVGWVESKDLLDAADYERAQGVAKELVDLPAQAAGHTNGIANLRLEPSRDAVQLAQLPQNQKLEVFGRRVVERPPAPDEPRTSGPVPRTDLGSTSAVGGELAQAGQPVRQSMDSVREAWYLVRVKSPAALAAGAGWVLGRFVELDIPEALSPYEQGTNLVAWIVLDTVEDGGQQVPQYLAADRVGIQELDFNHLRVFTWWVKKHCYATAYVEGNLNGYFPIRVVHHDGVPYFRLRLVDKSGRKFQKVYGLFDTVTRPIGIVEGWESDAMPAQLLPRRRGHKRRR